MQLSQIRLTLARTFIVRRSRFPLCYRVDDKTPIAAPGCGPARRLRSINPGPNWVILARRSTELQERDRKKSTPLVQAVQQSAPRPAFPPPTIAPKADRPSSIRRRLARLAPTWARRSNIILRDDAFVDPNFRRFFHRSDRPTFLKRPKARTVGYDRPRSNNPARVVRLKKAISVCVEFADRLGPRTEFDFPKTTLRR